MSTPGHWAWRILQAVWHSAPDYTIASDEPEQKQRLEVATVNLRDAVEGAGMVHPERYK